MPCACTAAPPVRAAPHVCPRSTPVGLGPGALGEQRPCVSLSQHRPGKGASVDLVGTRRNDRPCPKGRAGPGPVGAGEKALPCPFASPSPPAPLPSAAAFNDPLRRRSLLPRIPLSAGLALETPRWQRRRHRLGASPVAGRPRRRLPRTKEPALRRARLPRHGRPRPPAASVPPPPPSHWPGTVRAYAFRVSIGSAG